MLTRMNFSAETNLIVLKKNSANIKMSDSARPHLSEAKQQNSLHV